MRILLLTHFFPPETGAAGERTAAIVTQFVAAGHQVHVVTAMPSFPAGTIPKHYRGRSRVREERFGSQIERVWTYASPRLRRIDRIFNWCSVAAGMCGTIVARRIRGMRYDLIVASFPPITQSLVAIFAHRAFNAPLAVDMRDVLTTRGIELDIWRSGSAADRIVGFLSDALCRNAFFISSVSETACASIRARGVDPRKVFLLTNGFDFSDELTASPYARGPNELVAAYVGTLGLTSGVDIILQAAVLLRDNEHIRFVIAGDGSERARLEAFVRREKLERVTFLGQRTSAEARALQRDADIALVPLRAAITDVLPKKMFDALALGTPVVLSAGGEAARLLRETGGGIVVDPENPQALATAIGQLANDRAACRSLGEAGRTFVLARYERTKLVRGYVRQVASAL